MKKKQYDLIINSVYNAPLAIIIFIGLGLIVYTSPTANYIIDMVGSSGIYGIIPSGMYIVAILRNRGLSILLLFPLVFSILSFSTFCALIGTNGTLIDGGLIGNSLLKFFLINLNDDEYFKIFAGSLGFTILCIYLLFVFARGTYATKRT